MLIFPLSVSSLKLGLNLITAAGQHLFAPQVPTLVSCTRREVINPLVKQARKIHLKELFFFLKKGH